MKNVKKMLPLLLLCYTIACSCANADKIERVVDVMDAHPEAHSIMFFDPNTTFIHEGDKEVALKRLDYITFSVGFCYIKFVGEKEFKVFVDEPNYGHNCSMFYHPENTNDSFAIRLDHCMYFVKGENKNFISSFCTKSSEDRMTEYFNILYNKGLSLKRPTLEKLSLLIEKYGEGIEFYSFD